MNLDSTALNLKDSGIPWLGEIPEQWEVKGLKYIANLKSGETIKSEMIKEDGLFPVYGGNGLRGYFHEYTHNGDYVLIGRQGALCGNVHFARGKFWASEHAIVVSPIAKYEVVWLGELLRGMNLNQYSVSAAQPGLSVENISNLKVPFPTIAEQKMIAHFLDRKTAAIATLIAKKQRLIQLLEEKRTALINQAVTKGLNPDAPMKDSGVPWIGEIPEHWESNVKLRYLTRKERGSFVNGPFGSDLLVSELKPEGIPVIYIRDIKPYGYRRKSTVCVSQEKANQLNLFRVDPGDVIIAKVGDPPGDSCIYPESEPPGIVTQDVIRLKLKTQYNSEYISFMMNSGLGTSLIGMISIASTRERVSLGDFKSLRVVCPPIEEQQRIANFLDSETQYIYNLTSKTLASVEKLQEYRRSLITAAVTGKLTIEDTAA